MDLEMNCFYHPEREAVGMCVSCGKPICPECKVELGKKFYCNPCAERMFSDKLQAGAGIETAAITLENTSGQGSSTAVPKEIRGWNWGAFLLGWIWAGGNKLWGWLIFGLVTAGMAFIPSPNNTAPWIASLVQFIISVVLGIKGSEWAWQRKRWDNIEHFKRTQRLWKWWGVGVAVLEFVVSIVIGIIAILAAIAQYGGFLNNMEVQ
ncbi:MAG: hypothetical protein ABIH70_02840 [Chloroflexota bacterium]